VAEDGQMAAAGNGKKFGYSLNDGKNLQFDKF
jgi:hypothetical protein